MYTVEWVLPIAYMYCYTMQWVQNVIITDPFKKKKKKKILLLKLYTVSHKYHTYVI